MADLTLKIRGDSTEAQQAVNQLRQTIVSDVQRIEQSTGRFAQKTSLDFDTVFRQLTQFRIGLTQIARGDLGGVPNLIKGIQLAGTQIDAVTPKTITFANALKLLDTSLTNAGSLRTSKILLEDFNNSLQKALSGTDAGAAKLRASFQTLGVDIPRALANPQAAFKSFLTSISDAEKGSVRFKAAQAVLDGANTKTVSGAIEAANAIKQIDAAEAAAAASATKLTGGLSLATIAVGALAAAAIVTGIVLVALGEKAADTAEELRKLTEETGLAPRTVQELQAASRLLGTDFEKVADSFRKFKEEANEARLGNEDLAAQFKILGVSATQAASDPLASFTKLVVAINGLTNEGTKAKAAHDLLGVSLGQLAEITRVLTADNGRLKDRVQELAGTMDGEALEAARKYREEAAALSLAWDNFANTLGAKVYPIITKILEAMNSLSTTRPVDTVAFKDGFRPLTESEQAAADAARELGAGLKFVEGRTIDYGNAVKITEENIRAEVAKSKAENQKATEALDALYRRKNQSTRQAGETQAALLRAQLKDLQSGLRDELALYDEQIQAVTLLFNQKLITEQGYTDQLEALYRTRLQAIQDNAAAERRAINAAKLTPQTRIAELARVQQQEEQARRDLNAQLFRLNQEDSRRQLEADRQVTQERLRQQETLGQAQIALIQDQIDKRALTAETGEQRVAAIQEQGIKDRIALLQQEANALAGDPNDSRFKVLVAQIKTMQAELVKAQEEGLRKIQAARQRDLDNLRAYNEESKRIGNSINQLGIGFIDTFAARRLDVIRQQQAVLEAAVLDEFNLQKEVFQQELDLLNQRQAKDEEEAQGILRRKQEIANREVELEAEKEARLTLIRRQAQVAREEATPNSNRNVLGAEAADALNALDVGNAVIGKQTTLFEQVNVAMSNYAQNLKRQLPTAAQTVILSMRAMAIAAAASIAAFVSGEATVRQAAAGIVKAALEPYKQKAEVKAAIEYAEAASSFAAGDIAGGLKHTGAGLLWTGVGGLLGGIGNLVAGGGGAGAGAAATPTLAGTRQDQNTISTEERFRLLESGPGRPVTTIVLVTDRQMLVKDVEHGLSSSYQNDGTAKKIIDNATGGRPF